MRVFDLLARRLARAGRPQFWAERMGETAERVSARAFAPVEDSRSFLRRDAAR